MSMYQDAIDDGIRVIQGKFRSSYGIPCEICGREIKRTQYSRKRKYICDYCKGLIKEKEKSAIPDGRTKHEKRFEDAINEIKEQVNNFDSYEKAIKIARTRAERYGSIPEAMAAIELLHLKYKIIPQQRVGKYRVDFAIPAQKLIIEIDGGIYHQQETGRDADLQLTLGFSWRILHIPAEYIRKNINKLGLMIRISEVNA